MADRDRLIERIVNVKRRHEDELLSRKGVVSVGVGLRQRGGQMTNAACIVVMVRNKLPLNQLDMHDQLPTELEGIAVDVQESGEIIAR